MTTQEPVVFIVDDDPAVRDSLTLMIDQVGIRVKSFESAQAFHSLLISTFLHTYWIAT